MELFAHSKEFLVMQNTIIICATPNFNEKKLFYIYIYIFIYFF